MKGVPGQPLPLSFWAGLVLLFSSACSLGADEDLRLEPIQVPMQSDKSLEPAEKSAPSEQGVKAAPSSASEANHKKTYLYQGQHEFDPELKRPDSPVEPTSTGADWETIHARDKDLVLASFAIKRFAGETSHLKIDPIRYLAPKSQAPAIEETEHLEPGFSRQQKPLIFHSKSAGFAGPSPGWDALLTASFEEKEPTRRAGVSEETSTSLPPQKTILLLQIDEDPIDLSNGNETINTFRYRQRSGE